ncbi:MAG: CopG family transcriptional regulator [Proteobacteria bacterium]|nr:CopG family transcriptional regulator [Pseudomonadota bacterium]
MTKKRLAETTDEFDKRFDAGEDVTDLIDLSKDRITRSNRKMRITLDIAESLVRDIDTIREKIGVDRGALIKVWLHEKVIKEKSSSGG